MDAKVTRRGRADDINLASLQNLSQTLKFYVSFMIPNGFCDNKLWQLLYPRG